MQPGTRHQLSQPEDISWFLEESKEWSLDHLVNIKHINSIVEYVVEIIEKLDSLASGAHGSQLGEATDITKKQCGALIQSNNMIYKLGIIVWILTLVKAAPQILVLQWYPQAAAAVAVHLSFSSHN